MGLRDLQGPIDRRTRGLHSVQLDNSRWLAGHLVSYSSHGWHSFMREGAPAHRPNTGPWYARYNNIIRPEWIDVPLVFATGIQQNSLVLPRAQYRKAQSAKKTYALAQALRNSAQAIAAKR